MPMKKTILWRGWAVVLTVLLLVTVSVFAQGTRSVSGTVTDTRNEPLVGVTVHNEASGQYTTTGAAGEYTIRAGADDRLTFTYIGMITQTVQVSGRSVVNIIMSDDTEMLEETIRRDPSLYLWTHNRWKRTHEEFDKRFKTVNGKVIPR